MNVVGELAQKHGFAHGGKPSVVCVLKLLTSLPCESRIMYQLEHPGSEDEERFDAVYREKSLFATNVVIDHLKRRLRDAGFSVVVSTEEKNEVGKYDIVIRTERNGSCSVYRNGQKKVRIEVKASQGIPLEQLARYLLDPSPLVVVRVMTSQVVRLRQPDLGRFAQFLIEVETAKAGRLMKNEPFTVPGEYCRDCPYLDCEYNRKKPQDDRMVKMESSELERDLREFFANLPDVAERTAEAVLEELTA